MGFIPLFIMLGAGGLLFFLTVKNSERIAFTIEFTKPSFRLNGWGFIRP